MGLTAITHPTSWYTSDQLLDAANVGFTDKFKIKGRGLGTTRASALRLADSILAKLDAKIEAETKGQVNGKEGHQAD